MRPDQEYAFEAFVRVDGPQLLRAALLLTGDAGHADDVMAALSESVAAPAGRARAVPPARPLRGRDRRDPGP